MEIDIVNGCGYSQVWDCNIKHMLLKHEKVKKHNFESILRFP